MEDRTVTSHPQSGIVKLQGGDGRWYHVVALRSALLALRAAVCFSRANLLSSLVLFCGFFSSSGFFPVFGLSFGCFVAAFGAVWRFFFQFCGLEKGRKEGGTAAETSARYLRLFRSSFLTPTLHLVRNILRSIEGLFVTVIG
ncbi:unnamed protein product [Sphagnum troendelagicum]|uniref:Transmembrane protein n=1 Tax=Sphagnum troendelagicum TaxID=128251 RepID=A0ABP0UG97_9BRYO